MKKVVIHKPGGYQQLKIEEHADLQPGADEVLVDVAAEERMGALVGVTGTPSIILEDGRILPGYLPADRLAAELGIEAEG